MRTRTIQGISPGSGTLEAGWFHSCLKLLKPKSNDEDEESRKTLMLQSIRRGN